MNNKTINQLLCAFVISFLATAPKAQQQVQVQPQAEILHWWSSVGESAALRVLIDEFMDRGGLYYDSGKKNAAANIEEAIERMANSYPPTLTLWNAGSDLDEMHVYGLLKPIRSPQLVQRLKDVLPRPVLDVVTRQDDIIAIPLTIHTENWMWYSQSLLGHTEINLSGDWSELIGIGESLAEQGIPLLAVGDQQWQVRILFASVFLGVSRDAYLDFYVSNNVDVVDSSAFRTTLEVFNQLAGYSESFEDGNWNTQIKAVTENRAAANFMGDWVRGEFISLSKRAGVDYGCLLTSTEDPSVLMGVDVLVLGNMEEETETAGQDLMIDVVTDEDNSLQFNALKGSISPYSQPDPAGMDICASQVYAAIENEDAIIPPYQSYFVEGKEYAKHIDRIIHEFWIASLETDTDSTALVAQAIKDFRTIFDHKAKELALSNK